MSDACRSPLAARHAHHARFEPGAMINEPIIGPVVISQYIVPKKGEQKILVKNHRRANKNTDDVLATIFETDQRKR